jgi:hypothetical protein
LIEAAQNRIALREAAVEQSQAMMANSQAELTWTQDALARGELTVNMLGQEVLTQDMLSHWRALITNIGASVTQAEAEIDAANAGIAELLGRMAQARAEIDAWEHRNDQADAHGAGAAHLPALVLAQKQSATQIAWVTVAMTAASEPSGTVTGAADFGAVAQAIPALRGVIQHWLGAMSSSDAIQLEGFDTDAAHAAIAEVFGSAPAEAIDPPGHHDAGHVIVIIGSSGTAMLG